MKKETLPASPPSRRGVTLAILILALLGLGISTYLTIVHYSDTPLVCIGATGCDYVNHSIYSEIAGVAVAVLGAGGYLTILLGLAAERGGILKTEDSALLLFGVALTGTLYSAYLTYVELFVIYAICSWCVASAILLTAILGLSLVRLRDLTRLAAMPVKARPAVARR